MVERALTLKAAAAAFSVTVKTANKWVQRYRAQGQAGLYDRSSRPHRSPRRLPDTVIEHVIHLRRHHTPGYQIARRTAISPASHRRILARGQQRLPSAAFCAALGSVAGAICIPPRPSCATNMPLPAICSISTSRA